MIGGFSKKLSQHQGVTNNLTQWSTSLASNIDHEGCGDCVYFVFVSASAGAKVVAFQTENFKTLLR